MILVVDTNLLISHAELDGGGWKAVRASVAEGALTVVIPRVVVLELQEHIPANRRAVTPKRPDWKQLRRAPEAAKSAIQQATEDIRSEIEQWAASYSAEAVMQEAGFDVRPSPHVEHDAIVARATKRIRPFDANGGGYRDTLIWLTVLDLVRDSHGEEVVLLSADRKAFWQDEKLHPHLQEEVDRDLPEGSTFRIAAALSEVDIPSRFSGDEQPVELEDGEVGRLINALFANGPVLAEDLWISIPPLRDRAEPIGAEVSEPRDARLISAASRALQSGGHRLKVRVEVVAHVAFDWEDWFGAEVDGDRALLEIAFAYEQDGESLQVDFDSVDVRLAATEADGKSGEPMDGSENSMAKLLLEGRLRRYLDAIGDRPAADAFSSPEADLGKSFLEWALQRPAGRRLTLGAARAETPGLLRAALQRGRSDAAGSLLTRRIAQANDEHRRVEDARAAVAEGSAPWPGRPERRDADDANGADDRAE